MKICIYGAASESIPSIYLNEAEYLGEELAKKGHTIIFGGGATGIMGHLANGAVSQQGSLIGIAPHFFNKEGVLFQNCTQFIFTDTMRERKQKMEELSDVFIAMPGGIGTFEEFFEIYTLRQLEQHHKPIILFNINGYYTSLIQMLDKAVHDHFLSEKKRNNLIICNSTKDILKHLDSFSIM